VGVKANESRDYGKAYYKLLKLKLRYGFKTLGWRETLSQT